MGEVVRRNVKDIACRRLGDHQRVSGRAWHNVEEREGEIVLIDLVARQLTAQNLCKYVVWVVARHRCSPPQNPASSSANSCFACASPPRHLRNGLASRSSLPAAST